MYGTGGRMHASQSYASTMPAANHSAYGYLQPGQNPSGNSLL